MCYVKRNFYRLFLTPFYSQPTRFAGTSAGTFRDTFREHIANKGGFEVAMPATDEQGRRAKNGTIDWGSLKGQSIVGAPRGARAQRQPDWTRNAPPTERTFQISKLASVCNRNVTLKSQKQNPWDA